MATRRTERGRFPHVKGLQKKRTKNGHRWILTIKDSCGNPRSVTVKISDSDSEVEFWQKVNEARERLSDRSDADRFARLLTEYIEHKQLAPQTARMMRSYMHGFSLDVKANNARMRQLLTSGLKKTTLHTKLTAIRGFFQWLIRRGATAEDPTDGVSISYRNIPRHRVATQAELDRLLEAVRARHNDELLLFVLIAIGTGARVSSIQALKTESLDHHGYLHLYNVKARKPYTYPIRIDAPEILELWRKVTADGTLWSIDPKLYYIRLVHMMYKMFEPDVAGERLSPHSLRHTFATNAIQAGVPVEVISKMLDHSSISTTLSIYAKFSQSQIDDAVHITQNMLTIR